MKEIDNLSPFRVMVLSDHPTPVALRTHASNPSPFAILSSDKKENMKSGLSFNEPSAKNTGVIISPGHLLMDAFIKHWSEFIAKRG
jgi:2,3-bisphosphoglycerate-independent phosphoglycerate mutase